MNQQGWTLRRRVIALLGVVLVLLLGLAAAEATLAAKNRQNIDAVLLKTGPLRVQAQELMSALLDQETAVRGYAVNADRKDLAPYQDGLRRERDTVAEMRKLAVDYPDVLREVGVVEQRAAEWRTAVAEPVIATTERSGPSAGQALITDQTRQQFDSIRTAVDALQDEILEVRQETADKVNATSNVLVVLLIIAALVVAVAGAVLLLSLDRILIRPLSGLVSQVRKVASGDYRHHIEGSGPPEFRLLADDIDLMRQKIARELDEVREARESIEWVNSQLQKQAEELTRSNRDLEQFAYVASHDLQEPLRKVASFCQLLQRRYAGQLDERADQYIAFAVDGAQRMQRLINDLLAFSRIGRLTTGFTEVDLNKVMGDVAGQTEAARQYAHAELSWDELPVIRGEEPLLTNLLANLVSNSIKFRRRHRHRAGVRRQDLRDLPAAALQGRLPGHRHRAGHRQEDRRVPRRPSVGGHRHPGGHHDPVHASRPGRGRRGGGTGRGRGVDRGRGGDRGRRRGRRGERDPAAGRHGPGRDARGGGPRQ
ncbi:hypothetical protein GCM10027452_31220 [Micromonospora halotolerans]